MTEKELHKLRREDLLELLLTQSRELEGQKTRLQQLDAEREEKAAELTRLSRKLDERDAQLSQLLAEHRSAQPAEGEASLVNLELLLDEFTARYEALSEKLEQRDKLIQRLHTKLDGKDGELKQLRAKLDERDAEICRLLERFFSEKNQQGVKEG